MNGSILKGLAAFPVLLAVAVGPAVGAEGIGAVVELVPRAFGAPPDQTPQLVAAGYDVVAFDLADEAVAEVVTAGASPATDAASVAASCNVLLTSLPRPEHVEAVMAGDGALAALRPGSCWVDLTTTRRDLVLRLADAAPDGVAVAGQLRHTRPLAGALRLHARLDDDPALARFRDGLQRKGRARLAVTVTGHDPDQHTVCEYQGQFLARLYTAD